MSCKSESVFEIAVVAVVYSDIVLSNRQNYQLFIEGVLSI